MELLIILLTMSNNAGILFLPLTHSAVGIRAPFIGQKAASIAVFLHPAILKTGLIRLFSIMVGCIGQPLKRLAGSYAGSSNPIQSTAKRLEPFNGGLSLLHRNTIMSQYNSVQNPTPLFNVYFHRQLVCIGIAGALAMRIKRRYPACIVKFSGFEGGVI